MIFVIFLFPGTKHPALSSQTGGLGIAALGLLLNFVQDRAVPFDSVLAEHLLLTEKDFEPDSDLFDLMTTLYFFLFTNLTLT